MNTQAVLSTGTHTPDPPTTIKAARAAGYCKLQPWEYGGEQITVKGRVFARAPKEAYSITEWSRRGYRVRADAKPHCERSHHFRGQGTVTYPVFRDDQVVAKRTRSPKPAVLIDTLAALWTLNQRAKRYRKSASAHYRADSHGLARHAKEEKEELYRLKGQALYCLRAEGRLSVVGHHRFDGGNWAEMLQGSGYTFHRPCPSPEGVEAEELDQIEAKPKGAKEPRLTDALHTIRTYLADKPTVEVYEWSARGRARMRHRDNDGEGWDEFDTDD